MLKCFSKDDLDRIFREPFGENEAAFTHYSNNSLNGVSSFYKNSALNFINNKINIQISDEALQYQIFDFKNILNVPFPEKQKTTFKFIDLFAGVGGFRLALQQLGGKCIFSSEIDDNAKKTYLSNYGEIPFGDITKENIKNYIPDNFDILCGGFPCQAFSIAGNQKGFLDTRGTLFFDLEQIIKKKNPSVIFLENVKNLQSHDKGKTFKVMIDILEKKLGYKVFFKILNSMTHANIPQNRERIFIVAFDPIKVKNWKTFEFPSEVPLKNKIHDFIDHSKQNDIYYYKKNHIYYSEFDKVIKSKETVYQWRRVYVRENKSNVCPTLTANMGTGGHNVPLILDNYGFRKLTPRECFNFQGYPKEFILPNLSNSKLYIQAGNSVTMPLIKRIGEKILEVL